MQILPTSGARACHQPAHPSGWKDSVQGRRHPNGNRCHLNVLPRTPRQTVSHAIAYVGIDCPGNSTTNAHYGFKQYAAPYFLQDADRTVNAYATCQTARRDEESCPAYYPHAQDRSQRRLMNDGHCLGKAVYLQRKIPVVEQIRRRKMRKRTCTFKTAVKINGASQLKGFFSPHANTGHSLSMARWYLPTLPAAEDARQSQAQNLSHRSTALNQRYKVIYALKRRLVNTRMGSSIPDWRSAIPSSTVATPN